MCVSVGVSAGGREKKRVQKMVFLVLSGGSRGSGCQSDRNRGRCGSGHGVGSGRVDNRGVSRSGSRRIDNRSGSRKIYNRSGAEESAIESAEEVALEECHFSMAVEGLIIAVAVTSAGSKKI
jgi:hypothetical protein